MRRRRYLLPLLALVATALFYNWAWLPGSGAPGHYPRSVRSEHFVVRYTSWGSDRAAAAFAHELFHGIQAAYLPDLDRLPDFLVEGTPDACSYAVLDDRRVKDALLIDTATALQRVTGLPPAALLPVVALRLYGEYVWRADELGRNSPLPPDPAARFDLGRPPAGLAQRLRAGEPVTLGADDGGAPLTVRPQAVAAVSLDGAWRLPGHLEVPVQADAPVSVYLLHGGDDAARLADFAAVARRGGTPFVLTDDGGSRSILLVLAEGTDRSIGYRLTLRASAPGAAPTPLQPLPELLRHLETAG